MVPQWGMIHDTIKDRDLHCLHSKVLTIGTAIDEFKKQLVKMPTHVFKMMWQWEALKRAKAAMKPFEPINEKDYQVTNF